VDWKREKKKQVSKFPFHKRPRDINRYEEPAETSQFGGKGVMKIIQFFSNPFRSVYNGSK